MNVRYPALSAAAFLVSALALAACAGNVTSGSLPQTGSPSGASAARFDGGIKRGHGASPYTLIAPLVLVSAAPTKGGGGGGVGGLLQRRDKPGSGDTGAFTSGTYDFSYEYPTYHDECQQQHHQDPVLDPSNSGTMGLEAGSLVDLCRNEEGTGSLPPGETATALYVVGIARNEGGNGNPVGPSDGVTPLLGPAQLVNGQLVFPAPSNASFAIAASTQYYFFLALDRDSTDPLPHP